MTLLILLISVFKALACIFAAVLVYFSISNFFKSAIFGGTEENRHHAETVVNGFAEEGTKGAYGFSICTEGLSAVNDKSINKGNVYTLIPQKRLHDKGWEIN